MKRGKKRNICGPSVRGKELFGWGGGGGTVVKSGTTLPHGERGVNLSVSGPRLKKKRGIHQVKNSAALRKNVLSKGGGCRFGKKAYGGDEKEIARYVQKKKPPRKFQQAR